MDDKPRFEIIEQIGHGQFSNVYKARWVNAPLIDFAASCPATPVSPMAEIQTNPFLESFNQHQRQQHSPLDCLYNSNSSTASHNNNNNNYEMLSSGHEQPAGQKYVALKKIKFYDIQNSKLRMDCLKEVRLLQQLKHPNIINYKISFIERNELFIVLEHADGGDLSKLIRYFQRRRQLISERTILKYFTQVCSAIKYIHSKRILHRDIKPANIFMTSNGCVKLGDFGLSRFFSQNTLNAHSIVGTFYYMSPERIRETGYSFSSDVWSLGCVLYELITLGSPFSVMNIQAPLQEPHKNNRRQLPEHPPGQHNNSAFNLQWLIERICRAEYPSLDSYTEIGSRLRQLTAECLNPVQEARPTMDYICAVVCEAYGQQRARSNAHNRNQCQTHNPN